MTWLVALRLGRVSNLPTVWSNALTGIVLCGGALAELVSVALVLSLSLFYVAGMFLNDFFDREIDARERPERPIPSGEVQASTVMGAAIAMIIAGLALLLWVGYGADVGTAWRAPLAGIALIGAIVLYNWWHKGNPISPLIMGVCRMLVYVTAGYAVAKALPAELIIAALILLSYLIGLTYAAMHENLGGVVRYWPLIFLAAPFLYVLPFLDSDGLLNLFYFGFLAWVIYALFHLFRVGKRDVRRAVVSLIAGISLLDAMLIAQHGQPALAAAAVAAFALTLGLQFFVSGT